MAYQIPWQMLVPQGDAAHASMGTMDLGAIQQDRNWRQTQRNQLTADMNALNDSFASIQAVNPEQAKLLAERKAFYDQQRQDILNGKGFITDKYNKIKILGNQAANDPILAGIKAWTNAYNQNQLKINAIQNQDKDIALALQKDLAEKAANPFIRKIEGVEGAQSYNQYIPTNELVVPDLGADAKNFLANAGTEELITAGLRPIGKGQYLAINTNQILTEADALRQAADYISTSNKYLDYFNLKGKGRALQGLTWTEQDRRKFIEDSIRGAALNARKNDYDVQNLDLTPNYSRSGSGDYTGYDPALVPPPPTPVGTSTNVAETTQYQITNNEQLVRKKGLVYGDIKKLKDELELNQRMGNSRLTAADRIAKEKQLASLQADAKNLEQFETNFTKQAATRNDFVGQTAKRVLRWEKSKILKDGNIDLSANTTIKGRDGKYYSGKEAERILNSRQTWYQNTPNNTMGELLQTGYRLTAKNNKSKKDGKKADWTTTDQSFEYRKQQLENVGNLKLSTYEFTRALELSIAHKQPTEKDNYNIKKAFNIISKSVTTGTGPSKRTQQGTGAIDNFENQLKQHVQTTLQAQDKHLTMFIANNQSKLAPAKTVQALELPAVNKKDDVSLTTLKTLSKAIGDISDYKVTDHNGKPTKELTGLNAWSDDIKNIGQHYIDGKLPVTIVRYTKERDLGNNVKIPAGKKQYTIFIDPRENPAAIQALKNHMQSLYIDDPNGSAVENVMKMLSGETTPTGDAYREFESSLPEQQISAFHLRSNNTYRTKGAMSNVYTTDNPAVKIKLTNKETGAGKIDLSTTPTVVLYGNLKKKYPALLQKLSTLPPLVEQEKFLASIQKYSPAEQEVLMQLMRLKDLRLARWDKKEFDVNNRDEAAMMMETEDQMYSEATKALSALTPAQLSNLLKK